MSASLLLLVTLLANQDIQADQAALVGKWQLASATVNGNELKEEVTKKFSYEFTKESWVSTFAEKKDNGTYKLVAGEKDQPNGFDWLIESGDDKGKTRLAIYRIKDDELTICTRLEGDKRPTEFAAPEGSKCSLVKLKRIK